jgi:hypothetical protein
VLRAQNVEQKVQIISRNEKGVTPHHTRIPSSAHGPVKGSRARQLDRIIVIGGENASILDIDAVCDGNIAAFSLYARESEGKWSDLSKKD